MFGIPSNRQLLAAIQQLQTEVRQLMSQDSTIASEAAAEEASIGQINTALTSIQALLQALQGEQSLSPATMAAAAKVQADLAGLATTAQADVTADQPPAPPAPTA